jgi:pSer/pThr/pTyr-binding forkhead associated (FHA) protein
MNSTPDDVTQSFRPSHRPPTARLKVYDDASSEGETFRLRNDVTVIGRDMGEVRIPHDQGIAPEHLKIERVARDNRYYWELTDLGSETGLWVRVRSIKLAEGTEFLAGRHRFQFKLGTSKSRTEIESFQHRLESGSIPGETLMPFSSEAIKSNHGYSQLTYGLWTPSGTFDAPASMVLIDGSYWIGRDSSCAICLAKDVFLMGQHIEVRHENGWLAKTYGVRNGMWVRRKNIVVDQSCAFQLGEQRFHLNCVWQEDEV